MLNIYTNQIKHKSNTNKDLLNIRLVFSLLLHDERLGFFH